MNSVGSAWLSFGLAGVLFGPAWVLMEEPIFFRDVSSEMALEPTGAKVVPTVF